MSESELKALAKTEAEVIAEHFGLAKPDKVYRMFVHVGAYRNLDNAKAYFERERKNGNLVKKE